MKGKSTAFYIFALILGLIGLGLILRMGNVSVPLARTAGGVINQGFNALTLKNYQPAKVGTPTKKG